jgi:hypothetical protein
MSGMVEREIKGFRLLPGFLDRSSQQAIADALRRVIAAAPLVRPGGSAG